MIKLVKLSPKSPLGLKIIHALKNYNVLYIKKGINLVYVSVALNEGFERFDLLKELEDYLFSFVIYKNTVKLYLNKKVLKW